MKGCLGLLGEFIFLLLPGIRRKLAAENYWRGNQLRGIKIAVVSGQPEVGKLSPTGR